MRSVQGQEQRRGVKTGLQLLVLVRQCKSIPGVPGSSVAVVLRSSGRCQGLKGSYCKALERKQPTHISCKRIARERGVGSRVCRMCALSSFGTPRAAESSGRAAKQERRGEERREEHCALSREPWSVGLPGLSISSHAQALSSRRRRRCICSCDLDACLPCCSPRSPAVVFTRDLQFIYRRPSAHPYVAAQIRPPSPSPSKAPPAASVSHAAISGSQSIREG